MSNGIPYEKMGGGWGETGIVQGVLIYTFVTNDARHFSWVNILAVRLTSCPMSHGIPLKHFMTFL